MTHLKQSRKDLNKVQLYAFEIFVDAIDIKEKKGNENVSIQVKLFDFPWITLFPEVIRATCSTSMWVFTGSIRDESSHIKLPSSEINESKNNEISCSSLEGGKEEQREKKLKKAQLDTEFKDHVSSIKHESSPTISKFLEYADGKGPMDTGLIEKSKVSQCDVMYKSQLCYIFPLKPMELLHRIQRQTLEVNVYNESNEVSSGHLNLDKFSKVILRGILGPPYPIMTDLSADVLTNGCFQSEVLMNVRIHCFGTQNRMKVKSPGENPNEGMINTVKQISREEIGILQNLENFVTDIKFHEAIVTSPENLMPDRRKEYKAPSLKIKPRCELEDINFCPVHRVIGHTKEKITHEELRQKMELLFGVKFEKFDVEAFKAERESEKKEEEDDELKGIKFLLYEEMKGKAERTGEKEVDKEKEEEEEEEEEEEIKEDERVETESEVEKTEEQKEEEEMEELMEKKKEITNEMMMEYLKSNPKELRYLRTLINKINDEGEFPQGLLRKSITTDDLTENDNLLNY